MKLKLDGALGVVLMLVMDMLKIDLPEEPEAEAPIISVPVVGEPTPTTPTPAPTPAEAEIIEQIIEHIYPSPVVVFDDTEKAIEEAIERTSVTDTYVPPETITRTIHRTIE